MASGPVGPPSTIPPHVPMQPPTHPPTQLGQFDPTRVVPAEFGGRGVAATQETAKAEPRISRRKLLLGVGGLAGVAVAGGGAYVALGSKDDKGSGGNAAVANSPADSATSAPSNVAASVPTGSASSSADAATSSSSSPSESASASDSATEAPSATGSQPPLNAGGVPVGKIDLPGQPTAAFKFINGGKHLVVSDTANGVQIFDVGNPAGAVKVVNIPTPLANGKLQAMLSLDYSPARGLVALGGDGGLYLFDVKDPAKPVQLSARGDVNGKAVNSLSFNGDGTKLVIATDESDTYSDKPVGNCVMDVTDPGKPAQLCGLTPPDHADLRAIAFAAGDQFIVSTGKGENNGMFFQLWAASDLRKVNPVDSAAWRDPNGAKLTGGLWVATSGPWKTLVVNMVSADSDSQDMQFLDFSKPQSPAKQAYIQTTSGMLAFHPTRPIVAIGDARSGATTLYDMSTPSRPTQMARLVAEAGSVEGLCFNPDGSLLTTLVRPRDNYSDNNNAVMSFWKM